MLEDFRRIVNSLNELKIAVVKRLSILIAIKLILNMVFRNGEKNKTFRLRIRRISTGVGRHLRYI